MFIESLKLNIKQKIEYKASFIINSINQFFVFFTYYFVIIALFSRFNNIRGFSVYEILLCFGIIHFGYATCEALFRGIDRFEDLIIRGDLDRFLVRPRGILFQAMCFDIDLIKSFKALQSIIVIIIAIVKLNISWNIFKVITLILMLISSVTIFYGIFVLTASYCFITVQGLEVKNLFTDGGKYLAEYPIKIYSKSIIIFFTFVIPYGFINYYPLLYVIGRTNNIIYMFSPLVVVIFLIPCLLAFKIGLKHYSSTGS